MKDEEYLHHQNARAIKRVHMYFLCKYTTAFMDGEDRWEIYAQTVFFWFLVCSSYLLVFEKKVWSTTKETR